MHLVMGIIKIRSSNVSRVATRKSCTADGAGKTHPSRLDIRQDIELGI